MKPLLTIVVLAAVIRMNAQNIQFVKSVFSEQGPAGIMLTPNLKLENKGTTIEEINIKRVAVNLPPNWYTCFCYLQCLPPTVDTLHFFMAPGEIVDIGIGFGTDSIEGTGTVKIELHQVNAGQRDTLEFTGSTLNAGMDEHSADQFQIFPNPASDKIYLSSGQLIKSIQLTAADGKLYLIREGNGTFNTLSIEHLAPGSYFFLITTKQNVTKKFQVIKH